MSMWSKAFYAGVGAVIGGALVYYRTQKDTEDFQVRLDTLNENAKDRCDALRQWFASDQAARQDDSFS